MAQKDDAKPSEKKGSGILKILLMLIGGLVLIGGSVGGTLFLTGALNKNAGEGHSAEATGAAPAAHGGGPPPAIIPRGGLRFTTRLNRRSSSILRIRACCATCKSA